MMESVYGYPPQNKATCFRARYSMSLTIPYNYDLSILEDSNANFRANIFDL